MNKVEKDEILNLIESRLTVPHTRLFLEQMLALPPNYTGSLSIVLELCFHVCICVRHSSRIILFLCRPLRSYKCHVKMSRVTCHIDCIKHVRMSEIIRRMWWDNITCDIIWKVSEGETLPAMWKYQILLEYLRLFPPTSVLIRLWIWKSVKISDDTLWLWAWT